MRVLFLLLVMFLVVQASPVKKHQKPKHDPRHHQQKRDGRNEIVDGGDHKKVDGGDHKKMREGQPMLKHLGMAAPMKSGPKHDPRHHQQKRDGGNLMVDGGDHKMMDENEHKKMKHRHPMMENPAGLMNGGQKAKRDARHQQQKREGGRMMMKDGEDMMKDMDHMMGGGDHMMDMMSMHGREGKDGAELALTPADEKPSRLETTKPK